MCVDVGEGFDAALVKYFWVPGYLSYLQDQGLIYTYKDSWANYGVCYALQ